MSRIRQERTAERIREILSELLLRELRDPRLQAITVTDVHIDRELQVANVYVSALGDDAREEEVMAGLRSASGFLRRQVGHSLRLRSVPQLQFHWDPLLAQAAQIDEILDRLDIPEEEE